MVFSAITFLFFFLPIVLVVDRLLPWRLKNGFLFAASLVFYTWGAGSLVLILLGSMAVNFVAGTAVERAVDRGQATRARWVLALAVAMNLALLGWFKYANFAAQQAGGILEALGLEAGSWTAVLLPIGISFYTFHAISYLVDIYRGTARHLADPVTFGLYITFFPQLVAGPIVRFHEIRDQLVHRTETSHRMAIGVYRFAHGLGKKVLIADAVAPIADAVFATPAGELGTTTALLGLVAYTVQLYFDFSGYSDMAIGIGQMFGFKLPENFDRPYAARSVTEFWRRWHMSLSRWFRDYLYVPLGGNRGSSLATYRNLIIVFLATGLWHGAAWTFVVWGAYHGLILLVERRLGIGRDPARPGGRIAQVRTVSLVMLGWVAFRSPDLGYAAAFLGAFTRPFEAMPPDVAVVSSPLALGALAIGCASVLLPRTWVTGRVLEGAADEPGQHADTTDAAPAGGGTGGRPRRTSILQLGTALVVLPLALLIVVAGNFSPFLYFQF